MTSTSSGSCSPCCWSGARVTFRPKDVAGLKCSAASKAIIQRAIGERRKRWNSAEEMLRAFEPSQSRDLAQGNVDSLNGKVVVFTGRLAKARAEAARLVKQAGGHVKAKVGGDTDVVVLGLAESGWKAGDKGQKLLDVDRERESGHQIVVITEQRFRSSYVVDSRGNAHPKTRGVNGSERCWPTVARWVRIAALTVELQEISWTRHSVRVSTAHVTGESPRWTFARVNQGGEDEDLFLHRFQRSQRERDEQQSMEDQLCGPDRHYVVGTDQSG